MKKEIKLAINKSLCSSRNQLKMEKITKRINYKYNKINIIIYFLNLLNGNYLSNKIV